MERDAAQRAPRATHDIKTTASTQRNTKPRVENCPAVGAPPFVEGTGEDCGAFTGVRFFVTSFFRFTMAACVKV
ncbi:hypothetical protein JCM17478_35730 [Thermopirellula anaerolimosa]